MQTNSEHTERRVARLERMIFVQSSQIAALYKSVRVMARKVYKEEDNALDSFLMTEPGTLRDIPCPPELEVAEHYNNLLIAKEKTMMTRKYLAAWKSLKDKKSEKEREME
jgi:hypothetical protein